ncbi:MAG: hypothetical protein ABIF01_04335 [Candidatus Micrarchaeota archaeon]
MAHAQIILPHQKIVNGRVTSRNAFVEEIDPRILMRAFSYLNPTHRVKVANSVLPGTKRPTIDAFRFLLLNEPNSDLMKAALKLFVTSFPDKDEREPNKAIRDRIRMMNDNVLVRPFGNNKFYAMAVLRVDGQGSPLTGYCQWTSLTSEGKKSGEERDGKKEAFVYSQYVTLYQPVRNLYISTFMNGLRAAISEKDALNAGIPGITSSIAESEMKFKGHSTEKERENRLLAHEKQGKFIWEVIMPDGSAVIPWRQPPVGGDICALHLTELSYGEAKEPTK